MRSRLFLDIETVPDPEMARRVQGLPPSAPDQEAMIAVAPPRHDGEAFSFPKPLYHRVVAISIGVVSERSAFLELKAIDGDDETQLVSRFWSGFEAMSEHSDPPQIVTWNGRSFDLPVLVQRAFALKISPRPYLSRPDYLNRYRDMHLDVMDWLSCFRASPQLSLHEAAMMLGVPGKVGVDGGDVASLIAAGDVTKVRRYCTADVATLMRVFATMAPAAGWMGKGPAEALDTAVTAYMLAGDTLWSTEEITDPGHQRRKAPAVGP